MKIEITKNTIIKDLVEKHPSTVEVFRRHKLLIAGGVRGPNEPLGFFARAHDVNYDELVKELLEAIEKGDDEGAPAPMLDVDRLYENFVKAAIIVILTVGCTFGAAMLTHIGIKGNFGSIPYSIIQPHAFAQLFGWLGLCIMGFGYYVIPRIKGTELYGEKLPGFAFWLMIAAVALRTIVQPIPDIRLSALLPLSGMLLVAAVCLFAYGILRTMKQSTNPPEVFDKFFIAGMVWYVIASLVNLALTVYLFIYSTNEIPQSIFAPFAHLFLFGFVFMFIFAVNLRTVYAFLDLEKPITWLANIAFVILNIAVPIYVITTALQDNHVVFLRLSQITLYFIALAGFMFIYAIRIFGRQTKELEDIVMDRSYDKAIKAAYVWLIVALIIFVFKTFLKQTELAYLFHGSANHAFTVGFVTMMIIGYSSKMIPTFTGINLFSTRLSEITFILLNVGIFMRVFSQIMVGFYGGPFYLTSLLSGWIEVGGLALFGINLWKTMNAAYEEEEEETTASVQAAPAVSEPVPAEAGAESPSVSGGQAGTPQITKDSMIGDIIEKYPQTLDVLIGLGFKQLKNPIARKTVAKFASVEMASKMHKIDLNKLLKVLNEKC
ncbi:MAG: DUF1858 domain-containing protein [Candidatus Brocadiales bacterium]